MFCTNCGKKVPDESKFCPACGTFLYKEEEQITVKEQAPTVKPSPKPEPKHKSEITEKQQAATILTTEQEAPKIETGSYQPLRLRLLPLTPLRMLLERMPHTT